MGHPNRLWKVVTNAHQFSMGGTFHGRFLFGRLACEPTPSIGDYATGVTLHIRVHCERCIDPGTYSGEVVGPYGVFLVKGEPLMYSRRRRSFSQSSVVLLDTRDPRKPTVSNMSIRALIATYSSLAVTL